MNHPHIGTSFDSFLSQDGILEDVHAVAIKRVLVWQIQQAMAQQNISKSEMAKRMKTSRSQLDRLLDPENAKVQLDTVHKAVAAVGKTLVLELAG